jgi:hypothetical protein
VGLFHAIFAELICGSLRIAEDSEIDVLTPPHETQSSAWSDRAAARLLYSADI